MNNTICRGKLFEPGHFEDKGITITRADLEAAAAAFVPVDVNLDHQKTVLDGHLGKLIAVFVSADGTLTGEYEEPSWLSQVLGNAERKVSLEFCRATKKITGMALTLSPRIEQAALFAAFSNSKPDEEIDWAEVERALQSSQLGQLALDEIHRKRTADDVAFSCSYLGLPRVMQS